MTQTRKLQCVICSSYDKLIKNMFIHLLCSSNRNMKMFNPHGDKFNSEHKPTQLSV